MKKHPTVLIHIDDRRRDALAYLLLGKMLEAMGNQVYFCNRFTNRIAWLVLQPDAMVVPYVWMGVKGGADELAARAKRTKIIVLPTEGAEMPDELFRDLVGIYDPSVKIDRNTRTQYTRHVTKTLQWGRNQRDGLLERGILREDQVSVVGSIRSDLLRPEFRMVQPSVDGEAANLGFAGQFDSINVFDQRSVFQVIDGHRGSDARGRIYDESRELEDYFWSHYAYVRLYLILIEKIIAKGNCRVLYRAHPFEHLPNYSYLQETLGSRFVLDPPLTPLYQWLHSLEAVVCTTSFVGFEGMMMEKPVITVQSIIEPRLREHLTIRRYWYEYLEWCWRPKTVDEALDLMDLAAHRKLPAKHLSNPEFQRYIEEQLDWPRQEPSIFSAAKEIDAIAKAACMERPRSGLGARMHGLLAPAGLVGINAYRLCQLQELRFKGLWHPTAELRGKIYEQTYSAFYPWHRYEFRLADQLFPILARLSKL